MPLPRMPRRVTVRTPAPASPDPDTGNARAGTVTATETRAYLSQLPVSQLSSQVELTDQQNTTVSSYTLLVPAGVPLTARSEVVDEDEHVYQVIGEPAERRGLGSRVLFRAAALHRISDLQS